jgi:hypothetical protein
LITEVDFEVALARFSTQVAKTIFRKVLRQSRAAAIDENSGIQIKPYTQSLCAGDHPRKTVDIYSVNSAGALPYLIVPIFRSGASDRASIWSASSEILTRLKDEMLRWVRKK